MARSSEIQYVRFYSTGSAAHQVEIPEKRAAPVRQPKAKKAVIPIKVDGLAVVGTIVAAVMLVCMLIGFVQVCQANAATEALRAQVAQLELENQALKTEYEHGYDLEEIQVTAQAMGMIPDEQAQRITVSVPEVVEEAEPTWWESFSAALQSLFA